MRLSKVRKKNINILVPVNPVVLGTISSTYGIKGWLKIISFTQSAESIFEYQPWFIQQLNMWQYVILDQWKYNNHHHLIIKINSIANREAAKLFTNCNIIVNASQLPTLSEGDYYWKDILGCQVATINGYPLGKVIDLIETGSNDVMVIKANQESSTRMNELLVPFIYGKVIKHVDLLNHLIKVDWDPEF